MLCCLKSIVFDWRSSLLRSHDVKRNPPLVRSKFQLCRPFVPTTCCTPVQEKSLAVCGSTSPAHGTRIDSTCSPHVRLIDVFIKTNQVSEAQGKDFSRKSKWKLHTHSLTGKESIKGHSSSNAIVIVGSTTIMICNLRCNSLRLYLIILNLVFCSINTKQFLLVPLHFNKSIMLSITRFCEYFNLSYTRRPCLDAKSLLCATKKNLHGYRSKQD